MLQDLCNSSYTSSIQPVFLLPEYCLYILSEYIKLNFLSAETGELICVRFCSDIINHFKEASERLLTCWIPNYIPTIFFRGLSPLAIMS